MTDIQSICIAVIACVFLMSVVSLFVIARIFKKEDRVAENSDAMKWKYTTKSKDD